MTKKEGIDPHKKEDSEFVKDNDDVKGTDSSAIDEPDNGSRELTTDNLVTENADSIEAETEDQSEEVETAIDEKEAEVADKEPKHKKHSREKELESRLNEQHDRYLRLSAEFDNYRKRMLKERIELTQFISADIYTKMLPVIDDFERAMATIRQTEVMDPVKQGVELIYNKFKEHLNQQGIKEIDALHQEFNTDYHDAVSRFPVEDKNLKGKVIDVVEKGYILNDKVIRYCKVIVGE
jgi:molecular chaperone GrpE